MWKLGTSCEGMLEESVTREDTGSAETGCAESKDGESSPVPFLWGVGAHFAKLTKRVRGNAYEGNASGRSVSPARSDAKANVRTSPGRSMGKGSGKR